MLKTPRGTRDILGEEMRVFDAIERISRALMHLYGFSEIRTPIFESEALFTGSIGDETDIVSKEMFSFTDRKGRAMALRPEGTAGCARALIQAGLAGKGGITRWFYMGPMFRYERPQAGRYREFRQIGAEIFGSKAPGADLEIMLLALDLVEEWEIGEAALRLNFIGCRECRPDYAAKLVPFLEGRSDGLCEDCGRRLRTNPLRVLDCKRPPCREITNDAPRPSDSLCPACSEHRDILLSLMDSVGIAYDLDPSIVRGLDYYTRTVFEVTTSSLGAQDAVLGGGRYDNLVADLGGPPIPAVGFAAGLDRIASIIISDEGDRMADRPFVFVAWVGESVQAAAIRLASSLRKALGERSVIGGDLPPRVELSLDGKALRSQLRTADRREAVYTVILGEREMERNTAVLRDMTTGEQTEFELGDMSPAVLDVSFSEAARLLKET